MKTVEDAKAWSKEHEAECLKTYADCKDIPGFLRSSTRMEQIWLSGCWLNDSLITAGASDEQRQKIGFCHGQRCFFQDPWEVAVAYFNEFESNKAVKDQPGIELANELNQKHLGVS